LRKALRDSDPGDAVAQYLRSKKLKWKEVRVLAIGKSAEPMVRAARRVLGGRITKALIISPKNSDHPIPTVRSFRMGKRMQRFVLEGNEPLLCLISGGASSLAIVPVPGVTFRQKIRLNVKLLAAGTPIEKLNAARKKISAIKGGKLVENLSRPVLSLIVSDVIGDRLDVIASGLTVPKRSKQNIRNVLLLPSSTVANQISPPGWIVRRRAKPIRGDAFRKGIAHGRRLRAMKGPLLFVSHGETTVHVKGKGRGGRNLEFAMGVAKAISGTKHISLLSVATDGMDGTSKTGGAYVDETTWTRAPNPESALRENNTAELFHKLGDALPGNPTGINFADVQIGVVF
jgi:glycerate 2-kinase